MKHTEETKLKIAKARKEWLKNNPDMHPWRNNKKLKSIPCEKVKEFLKSLNIKFIEEYNPEILNRSFSIDIAIPDKMIALEINGNQHYEKTGQLKSYYQERHNLLELNGWTVYEIHYSACFNLEKWTQFVEIIKNSEKKVEFDYFTYKPKEKNKTHHKCIDCNNLCLKSSLRCSICYRTNRKNNKQIKPIKKQKLPKLNTCSCGNTKNYYAKQCMPCYQLNRRKIKNRPTKNELNQLLQNNSYVFIGKMYGVSDNTIRKWII